MFMIPGLKSWSNKPIYLPSSFASKLQKVAQQVLQCLLREAAAKLTTSSQLSARLPHTSQISFASTTS